MAGSPCKPPPQRPCPETDRLLEILARAASPAERLTAPWLRLTDPSGGSERFLRWVERVGGDRVEAMLELRGLTAQAWTRALGEVRPVPQAPLPGWALGAMALFQALGAAPSGPGAGFGIPTQGELAGPGLPEWADPSAPWRFHPGFGPWLDQAQARVDGWTRSHGAPLTPPAARDLTLALARRMLAIAGPLLVETAAARGPEAPLFHPDPAAEWLDLWTGHPVLVRLLAVAWDQWCASTEELLSRLGADLPSLEPGARVASLRLGEGDHHAGGRAVVGVRLDNGGILYLKPRSAGPCGAPAALMAAVDGAGAPLGLRLPELHARPGYAWVREVQATPCRDAADVTAYFFRAGALLRILQAAGATDLHHENFIPTREQPVLVDLETVFGPGPGWAAVPASAARERAVKARLSDTPAITSMVTSPMDGPPGRTSVDLGALAGPSAQLSPFEVALPVPTGEGLRRQRPPLATGRALPILDGAPVAVGPHSAAVIAGYREAEGRLRGSAPAQDALARAVTDGEVRFVPRATQLYLRLLQQSLSPLALSDGTERELVLERLWRAMGICPPDLIAAEVEALRDLDVPLFSIPMAGTALVTDRGRVIPGVFTRSPLAAAQDRLAAIADRRDQVEDLEAALFAVAPQAEPGRPAAAAGPATAVDLLVSLAHPLDDGGVAWLGLDYDPTRARWRHGRLGPGLLGDAGIGLALTVAGTLGGGAAEQALRIGRATLLTAARRAGQLAGWSGTDAFTGPCGTLYALARAGSLRGDGELLEAAQRLLVPVLREARAPGPGPVLDALAGGVLAVLHLPPGGPRDLALEQLAERLVGALGAAPTGDDPGDPWARSLPPFAAGRALALHRLANLPGHGGIASSGGTSWPGPGLSEGDPAWLPGEALVRAALGEPPDDGTWEALWWARAGATQRLLDCAELARASGAAGGSGVWTARRLAARAALERGHRRTGSWFGDRLAPDTRNLSALHGLAAIVLLDVAQAPAAPLVRLFH